MIQHSEISSQELRSLIRSRKVLLAGNRRLGIYGILSCKSGKRMLVANRVFFASEKAAIHAGYRPCAHCLYEQYKAWKNVQIT